MRIAAVILAAGGGARLGDAALSWPVDCPFVAAATVQSVVAAAGRERIVIPTFAGHGGHPTLFGAATWPLLAAAVDAPGGARAVIAAAPQRVLRLATADRGVLRDVDTVEDLA